MLASLSLIFLFGPAAAAICRRLRMPPIVGMLAVGALFGPYGLNRIAPSMLGVSAELRQMALIVILIKAGLSLRPAELRQVGRPALLLSFLPALCETAAVMLIGPCLLPVTRLEAALMGSVLAAVSPAVVVPRMVRMMEEGIGRRGIPQLILAGASLDDVFVIVLFGSLLGAVQGTGAAVGAFAGIPVSILLGALAGTVTGVLLSAGLEWRHRRGLTVRNSVKTILLLGAAFLLVSLEEVLPVPFSGMLAVMAMACALQLRSPAPVARRLSEKFGKLWIAAELTLFVLVGAAVDLRYTLTAGAGALLLIAGALLFRSAGVLLSLIGSGFSTRERLFCVIAYLPKATVQAAIGGVPLAVGLSCGQLVLSVAVLSIVVTAPLGAWGIDAAGLPLVGRD
ncbi:MAG: potassium transporter [Oscillospiraceae bacterium]|nr:MAG: potassium transporter [Oscillospiraceae bacterium]